MTKRKNSKPLFFKPARAKAKSSQHASEVAVTIDKLSAEGRGMAFHNGKPLFVANALPGDTLRVRIFDDKREYASAELIEIVSPSVRRITPHCDLFGKCGGCHLQMIEYAEQISHKAATLAYLLQPYISELDTPIVAEPWHYRHRARLAVSDNNGNPILGFKAANSHRVVAVPACPILDMRLQPLLAKLPAVLASLAQWQRIEELLLAIDGAGVIALDWKLARDLPKDDIKKLHVFCAENNLVWGSAELTYSVPSQISHFKFTTRDFTQINPAVNDKLVERALQWLHPAASETVADFFCGLGNFSLPLARLSKSVVGYEIDSAMVRRVADNTQEFTNAEFRAMDLFDAATMIPDHFDAALLDPPRAGAKTLCQQLAKSRHLQRIVYVSCNPHTLVRDLAMLTRDKFRVERAALVDMFPQTGHIEAMVLLQRR